MGVAEKRLIDEALDLFPSANPKLHMMAGQFYEAQANVAEDSRIDNKNRKHFTDEEKKLLDHARQAYRVGTQRFPKNIALWKLASRLEERVHGPTKARTVLERARLRNPKNDELWLEAARLEGRVGASGGITTKASGVNKEQSAIMAKALQECPDSGILLAETIDIAPRAEQRAASLTALKKKDNDPHVCLSVARLFWNSRKYAKARKWLERTVQLDPDFGDAWAEYYQFELLQGTTEGQEKLKNRIVKADPHHGEKWTAISKRTKNRRLKVDTLLQKVVDSLPKRVA